MVVAPSSFQEPLALQGVILTNVLLLPPSLLLPEQAAVAAAAAEDLVLLPVVLANKVKRAPVMLETLATVVATVMALGAALGTVG